MEYIEETEKGSCVAISGVYFVLTSDFKSNGQRMVVSLNDGSCRWINPSVMVENIDIFTFDKDTNILPIRQKKNEIPSILNQAPDIS